MNDRAHWPLVHPLAPLSIPPTLIHSITRIPYPVSRSTMIEPLEASMSRPPVLSDRQEAVLEDEDIESPHAVSDAAAAPFASSLSSSEPSTTSTLNDATPVDSGLAERGGEKVIVVEFEQGAGENPKEWSKLRKWGVTLACSSLCLTVALGSAMPTGDLPGAAKELHVSDEAIYLSISLFVLGFGVGPLLFAPLSEVLGRKVVYSISLFFYFIFTLPSCLAGIHNNGIATMLAGRMIAGIASSAPMTNVGGSIADIWDTADRGIPMAVFSATIFMGPCLGPLFGGWISLKTGQWRWIYWVLFILCGVVFAVTLLMPETLAPVLLRRKAARLNKRDHTKVHVSKHDLHHVPLGQRLRASLARPFELMFLEPIILCMSFYLSFVYSLLYGLFFAFPIAFGEIRGWNSGMVGVAFVSIILGIMLAMACMPIQERLYSKACRNGPIPEARLYPMMLGAIVLPISLFIFAFTSYPGIIWVGPCVAGVLFGFSMIIIYVSANSYIVDSYSDYAASAIAAKTLMRSCIGATVPLWITQLFHNLGFQYAGLFLALVSCLIMAIPYAFFLKGGKIRERSSRATKS